MSMNIHIYVGPYVRCRETDEIHEHEAVEIVGEALSIGKHSERSHFFCLIPNVRREAQPERLSVDFTLRAVEWPILASQGKQEQDWLKRAFREEIKALKKAGLDPVVHWGILTEWR